MEKRSLHWGLVSKYRTEIMGLACIWVVLHHYNNTMIFPDALWPLYRFTVYGNAGVDIFLFLSGIGLFFAFQKDSIRLGDFYIKRIVRLILPYILICVPYYIWVELYLKEGSFWLNVTQLSFPLSRMIATWYIPAMLEFYLLFPAIYKLQNTKKIKNHTAWVIMLSLFYALFLLVFKNLFPTLYENTEIALVRFIIFFVGCYFGHAVYEKKTFSTATVAAAATYIVMFSLLRETSALSNFWIRLGYGPLAISLCVLAVFVLGWFKESNILLSVLRFFGNRSLEIYLLHVLFNNIWENIVGARHFDKWGAIDYLIIVAVSIIVSTLAHIIIGWLSSLILRKRRGV